MPHIRPISFPRTQGELIQIARGDRTQAEFARTLNITQGTLSRYESEVSGASKEVINHCLRLVSERQSQFEPLAPFTRALRQARDAVDELERLSQNAADKADR
ncbi:MAG: XRE family transcriptional regulator [Xanthomonadaceae bacterium]|nr:XRE family transcriptional regulator [Xanthomonadaceae bacterium]